jgi:Arc/MetJ-type ribon-helix-helix transcriptional regulator
MKGNSRDQAMKKGKERVVGYVSRNIKELIREAIRSGDFASESDFVAEAVIKLAYEWKAKKEKKIEIVE